MSKRSDLPMSKENREYIEKYLKQYEPYPEGSPELDLDAKDSNPDRVFASTAVGLLRQDDEARKELGLKEGEYIK